MTTAGTQQANTLTLVLQLRFAGVCNEGVGSGSYPAVERERVHLRGHPGIAMSCEWETQKHETKKQDNYRPRPLYGDPLIYLPHLTSTCNDPPRRSMGSSGSSSQTSALILSTWSSVFPDATCVVHAGVSVAFLGKNKAIY